MAQIRVYKVSYDGAELTGINNLSNKQIHSNYQEAKRILIDAWDKYKEHYMKGYEVIHECIKEDDILGYRHQVVYTINGWAHIIFMSVEKTRIIIQ